jgi:hypothetical protein
VSTDKASWIKKYPWWAGIVLAVALLLLGLLVADARGQGAHYRPADQAGAPGPAQAFVQKRPGPTLRSDLSFGIEQWAAPDKTYMNRMSGTAALRAAWGAVWARASIGLVWWGAPDAKIAGSLWNLEATNTIEFRRFASAGVRARIWGGWAVCLGAAVQRRGAHHVWRHRERHGHFPARWEVGTEACNGGEAPAWPEGRPQCPSLGYWDVAAPVIGVRSRWLTARVVGPSLTWKTLTLPYPRYQISVAIRHGSKPGQWTFAVEGEAGGPAGLGYDLRVSRTLEAAPFLSIGLVASDHLPDPGWGRGSGDNLRRIGARVSVKGTSPLYEDR